MSQDSLPSLPIIDDSLRHIRGYRAARNLTVDYALGAAIIGLNPFPSQLLLMLLVTSILLLKMMRDIGVLWGFRKRQGVWAMASNLFRAIEALSMAFMAWLSLVLIGIFIPVMHRFAISAALFTLVLMIGFTTNHDYFSGYLIDTRGDESTHD